MTDTAHSVPKRYIILEQDKCVVRDTLHGINYHLATEAEAASIQEDLNMANALYLDPTKEVDSEQEAQHG